MSCGWRDFVPRGGEQGRGGAADRVCRRWWTGGVWRSRTAQRYGVVAPGTRHDQPAFVADHRRGSRLAGFPSFFTAGWSCCSAAGGTLRPRCAAALGTSVSPWFHRRVTSTHNHPDSCPDLNSVTLGETTEEDTLLVPHVVRTRPACGLVPPSDSEPLSSDSHATTPPRRAPIAPLLTPHRLAPLRLR